jgi:hypothetical protein
MDLTRIKLIRESKKSDLENENYLEDLIIKLGFNNETLNEQPQVVINNCGGLMIWQYPNQFSKYLCLLSKQNISSYIEIGCRWGGTFILTTEYLKKFNNINKSVAVDIIDTPVVNYCFFNNETTFIKMNSRSEEFKNYMNNNSFDLAFIDGDHSYYGVKNDYDLCKDNCKIIVFHDIINSACIGIVKFWNEIKKNESDKYIFHEFIEQYDDVLKNNFNNKYLGIGVAIKK